VISPAQPQAWRVWGADLDPQTGREQAGRRPVIVVGSPLACSLPNGLVIVVPCTTSNRRLPFQPEIDLDGRCCYAMCDQVKALSVSRLIDRHRAAQLPVQHRPAVRRAVRALLA
jgi:mRNA interferase MazF